MEIVMNIILRIFIVLVGIWSVIMGIKVWKDTDTLGGVVMILLSIYFEILLQMLIGVKAVIIR